MSTKARTRSKAIPQEAAPQQRREGTWADITDEESEALLAWFNPLCERLDETPATHPSRRHLCREVAQGYKQVYLPKEDMPTLVRWVNSYHCPTVAGHRRNVNGTAPVEDLLTSAGGALGTLLSPAELRCRPAQCNAEAAKWLRNVIIHRDTEKLTDLIRLIGRLPPSLRLHDRMRASDFTFLTNESRHFFAQLVDEAFFDFLPEHGRLPSKLELREAVEQRQRNRTIQTSQWSKTLKELGLSGLPRGTRGTIRRRT